MRRILTLLLFTTICSGAQGQRLNPGDYIYPIRGVAGLYSANFGEMRPGHFHGGIDIKTDGGEGKPLVAVADGYVSRVSVSPSGYGRAIYHARQRHDGRIRPPATVPRRHRKTGPRRTLPPPREQRRSLVRPRRMARRTGRHDRIFRATAVRRWGPICISNCATPRPSGSTTSCAKASSAPTTTCRPASCASTTSRWTACRAFPSTAVRRATPSSAKRKAATG